MMLANLRTLRTLGLSALVAFAAGSAVAQVTAEVDRMQKTAVTVRNANAAYTVIGDVQMQTRLSRDPDFGRHKMVVLLDLSQIKVTKGKTTYTTAYQEEFVRPLGPNDTITLDLPVTVSTATNGNATGSTSLATSTLNVSATLSMNVDTATGRVTAASAGLQ